jgi:hypothetical protein
MDLHWYCPSCRNALPAGKSTAECPVCGADFGKGSAWVPVTNNKGKWTQRPTPAVASKSKGWGILVFAIPAQWALISLYRVLWPSSQSWWEGHALDFIVFLVAPSLLLWVTCLLFRSRHSTFAKLIALAICVAIPILLYALVFRGLRGFSH